VENQNNHDNLAPLLQVPQAAIDAFGTTLPARVEAYIAAIEAHKYSIGIPRPTEHPLVEAIAAAGGMNAVEIISSEGVPQSSAIRITNRQLFAALALTGFITESEALAAGRTGEVPAAIDAVFGVLPEQDAFLARLTWATMREVTRDHPLIGMMIAANLATAEQVDAIFALGASIE
jgi:hypothetical protein